VEDHDGFFTNLILRHFPQVDISHTYLTPPKKMRNMPLTLIPARPSDAARIAEIHMAAFGSNGMLLAQFPTPAVRAALKTCIERKALDDINDPKTSVLVVRESPPRKEDLNGELEAEDSGEIISFAKWSHPILEGEDYVEPPWIWPEGTRMDVLEKWGSKLEEAQERALGGAPCYRKNGFSPEQEADARSENVFC
jgi:hypothetical protein